MSDDHIEVIFDRLAEDYDNFITSVITLVITHVDPYTIEVLLLVQEESSIIIVNSPS